MGLLHPFEFALAAGSAGVADLHTRLPPLAPHLGRATGPQLRIDASVDGLDLRYLLPTEAMAVGLRYRDEAARFVGSTTAVSITPAAAASQLDGAGCSRLLSGDGPRRSTNDDLRLRE